MEHRRFEDSEEQGHGELSRPSLVPWPAEIAWDTGVFRPPGRLELVAESPEQKVQETVATCAEELGAHGFATAVTTDKGGDGTVSFQLSSDDEMGPEDYEMAVRPDGICVRAANGTGLFWGTRTLLQLLAGGPGKEIPCLRIADRPLLGYRGILVDVARRFHSIEFHLGMIRRLAGYKLNAYHIHFSDDQSYTLPSEKFPGLPTAGRHYTRAEIRQLVELAERYHVTLVPEIDVPGHATSLNRGIPETNCTHADEPLGVVCLGSEGSINAVQELFTEVMGMIPGPYWHLGADEVRYDRYQGCSACEGAAEAKGPEGVHRLYREFINRLNQFMKANGRQMFVWEGFQPGAEPPIDSDIVVFPFDVKHPGQMPSDYLDAGYRLINSAWTPLYIADRIYMTTPEIIARWNPYMFGAGRSPQPMAYWEKLDPTPAIIGAQMCSWAIEEKAEEGLLFGTGPGFPEYGRPAPRAQIAAERMWTGGQTTPQDLLERTGASYWDER